MPTSRYAIMIFLTALVPALSSCKSKPAVIAEAGLMATGDNSQNALDWPGTYTGTLPCADCEGIATRTGSVAAGLEADLLVVARDPREDTSTLFEPMLIINNGEPVLNRLY